MKRGWCCAFCWRNTVRGEGEQKLKMEKKKKKKKRKKNPAPKQASNNKNKNDPPPSPPELKQELRKKHNWHWCQATLTIPKIWRLVIILELIFSRKTKLRWTWALKYHKISAFHSCFRRRDFHKANAGHINTICSAWTARQRVIRTQTRQRPTGPPTNITITQFLSNQVQHMATPQTETIGIQCAEQVVLKQIVYFQSSKQCQTRKADEVSNKLSYIIHIRAEVVGGTL